MARTVTWEHDECGTLRVQWKWNSKRAVSVTGVYVFSCDVRRSLVAPWEARLYVRTKYFFPARQKCRRSVLVGRWKISFGRSDQTEVERTRLDFRTDMVTGMVERCEFAPIISTGSTHEICTHIHVRAEQGWREYRKGNTKLFELNIDFVHPPHRWGK